jgi:hypothetical protein
MRLNVRFMCLYVRPERVIPRFVYVCMRVYVHT